MSSRKKKTSKRETSTDEKIVESIEKLKLTKEPEAKTKTSKRETSTDEKIVESIEKLKLTKEPEAKSKPIKAPEIILTGSYNGSPIKVYGEEHNNIDNRYYENLDLNIENTLVLVEYATASKYKLTKSNIDVLSQTDNKGAKWVWYKYSSELLNSKNAELKKHIKENFHCVDIREEIGLMSVPQEKYLEDMEKNEDIEKILIGCSKVFEVFTRPTVEKLFVGKELKEIYKEYLTIIYRQLTIISGIRDFNVQGVLLCKDNLTSNILKMSAFIVDLYTYQTLIKLKLKPENKDKNVALFVGSAHAYRLHKFFPKVFPHMETTYTQKNIEELSLHGLMFENLKIEMSLFNRLVLQKGLQ